MRVWLGGIVAVVAVGVTGIGWWFGHGPPVATVGAAHHALVKKRPVKRPAEPPTRHRLTTVAKPVLTLAQPTPTHPLTILVAGDSLGEDLQYGLEDVVGASPDVRIIPVAVGSSGLADPAFVNWPVLLAHDLTRYHPQLVMMLFGGNDAVSFDENHRLVAFGSPLWQQDYGQRVARMIGEARHSGAQVLWMGLPIMSPGSVLRNRSMEILNALYQKEAAVHPGTAYVSTWKLYQPPRGGFTEYLTDGAHQSVMVRDPDGVHIAPPYGQQLIADLALTRLQQLAKISVCVTGSNPWPAFPLGCPPR